MFEISQAKMEILGKLAERDWTPTDLAKDLNKSPETIYNHLNELKEKGVLKKKKVAAKTRPKTEYSIGRGFLQYIMVFPGQLHQGTLKLDTNKKAMFRIWSIPQEEFHTYLENFWFTLKLNVDIEYQEDIAALAVYGSVARGEADEDSDIDFLIITEDEDTEEFVNENLGSAIIKTHEGSKIGVVEVYTKQDYRSSIVHGSDFLSNIRDELHIIYDPDNILRQTVDEPT